MISHKQAIINVLVKQGLTKTEARKRLKGVRFKTRSRWSYSRAEGLPEELDIYSVFDRVNECFVSKKLQDELQNG